MPVDSTLRPRAWLAATLACVSLFWLLDLAVLRAGVPDPLDDTWEYGVVARSLLAGHGYRTAVVHPPLWTLRDASFTVPVLVHGPLMPLLVATPLRLAGPHALDRAAWLGALFALGAAWAVFRLGATLFEPAVGAAAALLLTASPLMLEAVHHDLSLPLGAALLTLAIEGVLRARPRPLVAGILIGIGALARPELLIAAGVLILFAGRGWWRFGLAVVACLAPWWIHSARTVGTPFFNLSSYLLVGYWGARPGIAVMRDFDLAPAEWPAALRRSLGALPAKWLDFLPHALKRALLAPSGGTGWLALAAVATLPRASRKFVALGLLLAAIPVAIMTTMLYDTRYLTPFLTVWTLGAALGARALSRRLPEWAHRPRLWIGALALLVLPSIAPAMKDAAREARQNERRLAAERQALAPLAAGANPLPAPVFSDTPDFVAWTTRRPAIWVTRDEYDRLPVDTGAPPGDRPARRAGDLTWFHSARESGGPP